MVNKNKRYWRNKNVFVTGCTGLLGSWLVKTLEENGAKVIGLIRDWVPKSNLILQSTINKIITVRGEVEDYFLLERILNEYEIDTVFHLAAQTIVGIANRNPISTFETNIKGTWNILEACRKNPTVKKVIIASSDKAYGEHKTLPYTEDAPLKGSHPYDVSKSCADLIAFAYYNTFKLPVCVTRCGNFFGGGDLNFNRIIPGTIRSVIFNEKVVIRSNGKFIRDYIYILDAVNAYLYLAEKMDEKNVIGEAFNFSNEIQLTVIELVNKILSIMDRKELKPIILNEVKGEIVHQYLSAAKAKEMLGWSPIYGFEEGLRETIEWYKEFFKDFTMEAGNHD
ncbi:MAG: sugar dehydratase [Actinobacteria bacterium RBG_19FT_COMBO_36_27]|nr:MAG: sugar dehydratase [Actinobacteria bacterium RBG_19FT_COMBO_36_27]